MKKEKKVKEPINIDLTYIPYSERPIDPYTGKRMEMGRRGNTYQDMINEIREKNIANGIDNSSSWMPDAKAEK